MFGVAANATNVIGKKDQELVRMTRIRITVDFYFDLSAKQNTCPNQRLRASRFNLILS
jgi:hypothetical protein